MLRTNSVSSRLCIKLRSRVHDINASTEYAATNTTPPIVYKTFAAAKYNDPTGQAPGSIVNQTFRQSYAPNKKSHRNTKLKTTG